MSEKRAVGVIRVSRINGRAQKGKRDEKGNGDAFRSPEVQREKIEALRERHRWRLVDVLDENEGRNGKLRDASGAKSLAERPKMLAAVEMIERGQADVLAVAYSDRLTWTPRVRDEIINRVEAARGEVWTADNGRQSNATAVEEFTGATLTQAARFLRRQAAEKARAAQVEAVADGVWMSPSVPPGYVRGADRRLMPDPALEPVVREAFELRAMGATVDAVRGFLADNGIERTRAGVATLLRSRTYVGELRFGELHNVEAHAGIVPRELFERVQRVSVPRGRQAKSQELLARLGVLRCASCDGRLSVTTSNYRYRAYRCGNPDCAQRVSVSAPLVEDFVVEYVKLAIAGITETAYAEHDLAAAERDVEVAEDRYEAAARVLDPTEPAEVDRLHVLRDERDEARQRLEDRRQSLGLASLAVSVDDWDELSWDEKRNLIRAVIERVVVRPGRGPDKVEVEPRAL